MKFNSGFTLIELMTVLLMIGLLSAIVYPSYQKHVISTRRLDGKTALLQTAALMEHYYTEHNSYANANLENIGAKEISSDGYYHITLLSTNTGYSLTANPIKEGPQALDTACSPLSLDNLSIKGPDPMLCW
jgi:type IV pilus assembly protein PilE